MIGVASENSSLVALRKQVKALAERLSTLEAAAGIKPQWSGLPPRGAGCYAVLLSPTGGKYIGVYDPVGELWEIVPPPMNKDLAPIRAGTLSAEGWLYFSELKETPTND